MRNTLILLLTTLTLTAGAIAQRAVVRPADYDLAWGRGSTSALGSNSSRTQMVFAQPFATGTPVFGIGMRPTAGTVDRAAFTADIEIQLSSTPNVPGALSATFANNIGSDMVVALPRQTVNIQAMPANRSTGEFARFVFPQPFVFGTNNNTNLVVDLFVYGRSTGASWSTDRAFAATSGRVANAGIGCGAATISSTSAGGTYVAGSTLSVTLAAAPASTLALLLPSFDMKEFTPGVPLPFDLGLIGAAAGCNLLLRPMTSPLPLFTDAAGAASVSATVPMGLSQIGVGWQWLYLVPTSPANPLGLETTANRSMWIGPEVVVPNAQYVWDLSNVNAVTGNATTDSVPIVLFLIP
jgi:hypothetical protein